MWLGAFFFSFGIRFVRNSRLATAASQQKEEAINMYKNLLLYVACVVCTPFYFATEKALASETQSVLDSANKGWFNHLGEHRDHQNTYTGLATDDPYITDAREICRSFFVFDLRNVALPVSSAELRMSINGYFSNMPSEILDIYDVSTSATDFNHTYPQNSSGLAIFDDLGSGNSYGSFTVLSSDNGKVLDIPLNSQAVSNINASPDGFIVFGITARNAISLSGDMKGVRFSNGNVGEVVTNQLLLTPVPEPSTVAMLLPLALGGLLWWRRRS